MISGVLAGFSDYLGIDVTILRIGYVLLSLIMEAFPGIILYIILAIVMPDMERAGQGAKNLQGDEKRQPLCRRRKRLWTEDLSGCGLQRGKGHRGSRQELQEVRWRPIRPTTGTEKWNQEGTLGSAQTHPSHDGGNRYASTGFFFFHPSSENPLPFSSDNSHSFNNIDL